MQSLIRARSPRFVLVSFLVLSLVLSACAPGAGQQLPVPGNYNIQKSSVQFDGERYGLFFTDTDGSVRRLDTRDLRLVRDPERTYLEVPSQGDPILHLREDEPIAVQGQDQQGSFSSPWFPFLLGTALGSSLGGGRDRVIINQPAPGERSGFDPASPSYRYPPTGSFGRGESLHGTLDASKPQTPDYGKVAPQPYATAGQSAGTGGGTAATSKSPAGTSAATAKGGFQSGSQSFSSKQAPKVGAGSNGGLNGGGSSGSLGGKPSVSTPSKGLGGSRMPKLGRR